MRYLLSLLVVLLAVAPVLTQEPSTTDEDLLAVLQDYIEADAPGAVVYLNDNGVVSSAAFGLADVATGAPVTVDDLFRIGSVTKPMTAATLLTLVEAGEIDLDAPLATYLDADLIAGVANAETATVRQMLQMTSGITSYTDSDRFNDAVFDDPSYSWTAAETVAMVAGEPADFAPGESYNYSNTNYNLAELIIASVSGMSLSDAMMAAIFEPLDMTTCYVETPDRFASGIVRGYTLDDDGITVDITDENDGVGLGDGGVVCTAADLAKFPVGLLEGEVLDDDTLNEMLNTVDDGDGGEYGLGISYEETEYGLTAYHDGATSGFQSTMIYLPDEGLTVVVLTNQFDDDYVEDIALDVLDLAFGE